MIAAARWLSATKLRSSFSYRISSLRKRLNQLWQTSTTDAPEGRALLRSLGAPSRPLHLLMDRAYEDNETRQLALDLGFIPIVPPLSTRIEPWEYDREMYKRRNQVKRLFRRLKGFRRIFSRFEKLDVIFIGFISFALIADGLRLC